MRGQFFRVRVWGADDLIEAVFRNYHKFDKELQAEQPLIRVWTLIQDWPRDSYTPSPGSSSTPPKTSTGTRGAGCPRTPGPPNLRPEFLHRRGCIELHPCDTGCW